MRLRNVKGSKEAIEGCPFVIKEPSELKGRWSEYFGNDNPIYIEIGMGKGKFLMENASKFPNINYIGIEMYSSVLVRAIEKCKDSKLNNLVFIRFNAESINEIFEQNEISIIYLNFSDPWPKDRHAKRRLTSKEFLQRYDGCLKSDGEIIFKTDNRNLFDFSLEQIEIAGWKLRDVNFDLHHSELLEGNIMTEYEEKFVKEGKPIHKLIAYRIK